VTSLGLGRDDAPDFLNVSLSQTDRVGHAYGPLSREQLDNLLRLDRELGEFFTFLDRSVGASRWVVGLSADHGSLVAPETARHGGGEGAVAGDPRRGRTLGGRPGDPATDRGRAAPTPVRGRRVHARAARAAGERNPRRLLRRARAALAL